MNVKAISQEITQLPLEEQCEVLDFVTFLQSRHKSRTVDKRGKGRPSEAPFIGMWKGREDMADSVAWVRKVRREQWTRHG